MNELASKSLPQVLMSSAIILTAVGLFTFAADLPHVLLITLLLIMSSLLIRKPVKITDRSIIYFLVSTVILAVSLDYMFPLNPGRFGFIGAIFHPELMVPIAVYTAVFLTFFRSGPHIIGGAAAAALLALMFGGDVFNFSLAHERLPMLTPFMKHFKTIYITSIVIVSILILIVFRLQETQLISGKLNSWRWLRLIIILFTFAIIPLLVLVSWHYYLKYENQLRRLENYLIFMGRNQSNQSQNVTFGREVDLNRTINSDMLKNQKMIVVRVKSINAPGYLRGNAYVNYNNGRWFESLNRNIKPVSSKNQSGILAFKTFYLKSDKKEKYVFDIITAKGFISKALLVPGDLGQMDMIANNLSYTKDGVFEPQDWEKDGGYTVFKAQNDFQSAWSEPDETGIDEEYLSITPQVSSKLDDVINSIPGIQNRKNIGNDQEIVNNLLGFFSNYYKYSIDVQNTATNDPVIHFLTVSKRGHCELYASGMALLLRKMDIPSRYITGFICDERNVSGNYYVARLGNAHAWLEFYNRESKKWIAIEPTPVSGTPNFRHDMGNWESAQDRISLFFQQLLADLRRGYFAKIIVDTVEFIIDFFIAIFWHPVRGIFGLAGIMLLCIWLWRHLNSIRNKTEIIIINGNVIKISQLYQSYAKKISKHYHLTISHVTTVIELCNLIKIAEHDDNRSASIIALLNKYQTYRYRKVPPSEQDIEELKKEFNLLSK